MVRDKRSHRDLDLYGQVVASQIEIKRLQKLKSLNFN